MYTELGLYIEGKWLNGDGRKGEDVINPATGKALARLPHASKADLDHALAAAEKGFAVWKAMSAYDRSKIMRKAADLLARARRARRHGADDGAGQVIRRIAHGGFDLGRHHRLVRRRRPPRLWPHRAGPAEGRAPDRDAGAGRRRRRLHAVEFPDADAGAQDRRRAGRGLLAHHQGLGRDPRRLRRAGQVLRRASVPAGVLNLVFGVPSDVSEHLIPSPI